MPDSESISCPVCGADVDVDSFLGIDDSVTCNECEAALRIVDLDPLTVEVESTSAGSEDDEVATGALG